MSNWRSYLLLKADGCSVAVERWDVDVDGCRADIEELLANARNFFLFLGEPLLSSF